MFLGLETFSDSELETSTDSSGVRADPRAVRSVGNVGQ